MIFADVKGCEYSQFHELLNAYYREGEDAQTPQPEIDGFIRYLHELCTSGKICGAVAYEETPVGFVLWMLDSADGPFSNKPGLGTVLEIGVTERLRGKGFGRSLVKFAESRMEAERYYVCAYGPAEAFWQKCGYAFTGEFAENGLKIMVKG